MTVQPASGTGATVRTEVEVPIRTADGFEAAGRVATFHGLHDEREHIAIQLGELREGERPLVRMHSECLTGDVFGSTRCDCGPQLRESLELVAAQGGWLLYLRQEGRGIGLYNKLDAYALQDGGADTYEANRRLGFDDDHRDYRAAAQMLEALGVSEVRLLSNNPDKQAQLEAHGIDVDRREPTGVFMTADNEAYLRAKVSHTGHGIELPALVDPAIAAAQLVIDADD
ncbi:MAG: ribA [Thermoleophilia bacterium]|nr:ribA [Thermoleophilia bacterium]